MAHKQCHLLISRCREGDFWNKFSDLFAKENLLILFVRQVFRWVRGLYKLRLAFVWQKMWFVKLSPDLQCLYIRLVEPIHKWWRGKCMEQTSLALGRSWVCIEVPCLNLKCKKNLMEPSLSHLVNYSNFFKSFYLIRSEEHTSELQSHLAK